MIGFTCKIFGHAPMGKEIDLENFEVVECGSCGKNYIRDRNRSGPKVSGTLKDDTVEEIKAAFSSTSGDE